MVHFYKARLTKYKEKEPKNLNKTYISKYDVYKNIWVDTLQRLLVLGQVNIYNISTPLAMTCTKHILKHLNVNMKL